MSMKLDENSFNLKEEEFKGGGFGSGLPHGVSEVDRKKIEDIKINIENELPDVNFNNEASLLQIKKTTTTSGIGIIGRGESETFKKFNKLFGEEKKGKSLHFLKASFFKTDENTIYTYSEHRTPMELVEDFPEYYKNVFERDIVLKVNSILSESDNLNKIKAFVTLINIIYLLCKKIKEYFDIESPKRQELKNSNNKEFLSVSEFITLLDNKENDLPSLKDIFTTGTYKDKSDNLQDVVEGEKITDLNIFNIISLSKTKNISLKFIINKLYELTYYLNKIITEIPTGDEEDKNDAINILKPEFYILRTGSDINYTNYQYLYDAVEKNLENLSIGKETLVKFKKIKLDSNDDDIVANLNILIKDIFIIVLNNFVGIIKEIKKILDNDLDNNNKVIDVIDVVLANLKTKIYKVKEENNNIYKINKSVDDKLLEFKSKGIVEQEAKVRDLKAQQISGLNARLQQMQPEYDSEIQEYIANYNESNNKYYLYVTEITSIYDDVSKLLEKETITKPEYENMREKLTAIDNKITEYKETVKEANQFKKKATELTNTFKKEAEVITDRLIELGGEIAINFKSNSEVSTFKDLDDQEDKFRRYNNSLIKKIKYKHELQISKEHLLIKIDQLLETNKETQQTLKKSYEGLIKIVNNAKKIIEENIKKFTERSSDNADFSSDDKVVEILRAEIPLYKKLVKQAKDKFDEAKKKHDEANYNLKSLNDELQKKHRVPEDELRIIDSLPIEDKNEEMQNNAQSYDQRYNNIVSYIQGKKEKFAQTVVARKKSTEKKAKETIANAMRKKKARTELNKLRDEKKATEETKGGKSNIKELRRKLNTMSIKQLKRLSTKNNIEYGNKNTIKSLINNYIKHIKVN